MAKALREPRPSSTVARLLDPESVRRATLPLADSSEREAEIPMCAAGAEPPAPAMSQPAFHRLPPARRPIKREVLLTAETDAALEELLSALRRTTGARVSASHVVRAMLGSVSLTLPAIQAAAEDVGHLRLPANGPGREGERQIFERRLAEVLLAGFRDTRAGDVALSGPPDRS